MMLKILIVEGNVKELRQKAVSAGILTQSDLYKKVLNFLANDLDCTIIYPADEDFESPSQDELATFDGIVWTGSALNIYDRSLPINQQIDFMRTCFEGTNKIFGSCWGLQVATVAMGGEVGANEKGREIGIGREITITNEGLSHPLYAGKPSVFDAVTIHQDHVVQLPKGAKVLSGNDISSVQGIEIIKGESVFWGVQYHPEFDLAYISALIKRYGDDLIKEGICENSEAVEKWSNDLKALQKEADNNSLVEEYDMKDDVLDAKSRLLELSNWLAFLRQ